MTLRFWSDDVPMEPLVRDLGVVVSHLMTFEEGAVAYDHRDGAGFIKLNALRLRTLAKRDRRSKGV